MKKKVITATFILFASLLSGTTVFAEPEDEGATTEFDIGYTGPVDIITGDPVTGSGDTEDQLVQIAAGVTYDRKDDRYIYTAGDATIRCSIADGMIVTDGVVLSKDGEVNIAVFKDGESMSDIPAEIEDPGNYVVVTKVDNSETQLLSFQIVNSITGKLNRYLLPGGFSVRRLSYNGEDISHQEGAVDFTKEGKYVVNYFCSANSKEYKLDVEIDHTSPAVTFLGLDEDNEARGPVTFVGMEKTDKVTITYDGEEQVTLDEDNQVSETGSYHAVITDEAGNFIEKDFRILLYLNFNAALFVLAIILAIVGVTVALIIARKRLRVR